MGGVCADYRGLVWGGLDGVCSSEGTAVVC